MWQGFSYWLTSCIGLAQYNVLKTYYKQVEVKAASTNLAY